MKIYLAAPLFSEMERDYIEKIVKIINKELNLNYKDFYIPHKDNDYNSLDSDIYENNIKHLNECNIMIAILDGQDIDSGTAFEIGYFEAKNKSVFGLLTDKRSYEKSGDMNNKLNTMIYGACQYGNLVFRDIDALIDELHKYLMVN